MSTKKPELPREPTRETLLEIVSNAIAMHSSPSIDRSDSHGARGQAAYLVVDNHVRFVAMEIAEKLGEARIELTVCRGCDLSGEFHVLTEGRGCELCDGGEPVTGDLLRDLASRIPNASPKTGANPLLELAKEFELPLDAVYSYAGWVKRQYVNAGLPVDPTFWEAKAAEVLKEKSEHLEFTGPAARIRVLMHNFVRLQGSA